MARSALLLAIATALLAPLAFGENAPPAAGTDDTTPQYHCPYCHDTGKIECPACRQGLDFWCSECARHNICPVCHGLGWILCPYCGGKDARSEHDFLLEQQRKNSELEEAVGTRLRRIETPRFRLVTDIDHQKSHDYALLLERFCRTFNTTFGKDPDDRAWDGRCNVYLFQPREAFVKFAAVVDGKSELAASGGYSYPSPGGPMIVLFKEARSDDDTIRIIIHELAHIYLNNYRPDTPGHAPPAEIRLPVWVHEGVAQRFEFSYKTPTSRRGESLKLLKHALKDKTLMPLQELAEMKFGPAELLPYAASWSAVDFLMTSNRPAFITWIKLMKDGQQQHDAFRNAFGFPIPSADRPWRAYISRLK